MTPNQNTDTVQDLIRKVREAEKLAREFDRVWDTPNTNLGVEHAEQGRISWTDLAALFARSYGIAKDAQ